jgi:hypothetical protein
MTCPDLVDELSASVNAKMDAVVGRCATALDATFVSARTRESNVGSFMADILRRAHGSDIGLICGGCIRADETYPAGSMSSLPVLRFVFLLPLFTAVTWWWWWCREFDAARCAHNFPVRRPVVCGGSDGAAVVGHTRERCEFGAETGRSIPANQRLSICVRPRQTAPCACDAGVGRRPTD